jgi:hypothetical protein
MIEKVLWHIPSKKGFVQVSKVLWQKSTQAVSHQTLRLYILRERDNMTANPFVGVDEFTQIVKRLQGIRQRVKQQAAFDSVCGEILAYSKKLDLRLEAQVRSPLVFS